MSPLTDPLSFHVPAQPLNNPLADVVASPVLPPQAPAKVKKGVKRKADTTTPTATAYDAHYASPLESKSAKISTRRESGRQIKKVGSKIKIFLTLTFQHKFIKTPNV